MAICGVQSTTLGYFKKYIIQKRLKKEKSISATKPFLWISHLQKFQKIFLTYKGSVFAWRTVVNTNALNRTLAAGVGVIALVEHMELPPFQPRDKRARLVKSSVGDDVDISTVPHFGIVGILIWLVGLCRQADRKRAKPQCLKKTCGARSSEKKDANLLRGRPKKKKQATDDPTELMHELEQ